MDDQALLVEQAISGRVLLENGAPPPEPVAVMLSCGGPKPASELLGGRAVLTNMKGDFCIPLSVGTSSGPMGFRGAFTAPRLQGCVAVIRVPGYAPYEKDLSHTMSVADCDLGKIHLRRLAAGGVGTVLSNTASRAPERARREYRTAVEDAYAHRDTEALGHLKKTLSIDPGFASAHYLAGYLYDRAGRREEACAAYLAAANADPVYVNPLVQLAKLAAEDQDYALAAKFGRRVVELIPGSYAEIYLIAAGAEFNQGDVKSAERTAREGIEAKLDAQEPRLRLLLAESLWKQSRYEEARREYAIFAEAVKEGPEAESARKRSTGR